MSSSKNVPANLAMKAAKNLQSEFLNMLYKKNADETSVAFKGPLPRSILDA